MWLLFLLKKTKFYIHQDKQAFCRCIESQLWWDRIRVSVPSIRGTISELFVTNLNIVKMCECHRLFAHHKARISCFYLSPSATLLLLNIQSVSDVTGSWICAWVSSLIPVCISMTAYPCRNVYSTSSSISGGFTAYDMNLWNFQSIYS